MERKELKELLAQKYGINTLYSDSAIFLAQQTLDFCIERGQNPKKLAFGSRELFEKLKKKHLTGKRRGLSFKEGIPKNHEKLLEDKEFLSYSVARAEDKLAKLKKELPNKRLIVR
ncbi:MAG: hypothetical protein ACO2OT_04700 [Candidatus Caldipriscus sp.]